MKLAANWIMGDIAAYMNNEKLTINEIKLVPQELAELIASIKGGTISGKIGKEVTLAYGSDACYFVFTLFFFLNLDVLFDHRISSVYISLVHLFVKYALYLFLFFFFFGLVN